MRTRLVWGAVCAVLGAGCLLTACGSVRGLTACPYTLEDARVVLSPPAGALQTADTPMAVLQLELTNHAQKRVTGVVAVCALCTADGESVLAEPITACSDADIAPEATDCCTFALDAFLPEAPTEPLFAADVYVQQLRYEDGAVWRDPFGLHAGR